ncbi:Sugar ABC transporter permease OS=Streptomyces fumanus OX=67302 GN=GCM10018772_65120 PE=3 SV=1 [Streptomyces fumanus]
MTATTTAPVAAPDVRTPARRPSPRLRAWATRAPLLPALVFMIAVTQLPFVATLVISFFDWNSLDPDARSFTGLANYGEVLSDADLRKSVWTTVLLTVAVVLASLILGLALALLLDRRFRGRGLVRTLLIAPFLVVPVAAALLWKHVLYNPEYGLLNGLLHYVGGPQPDWISDTPLLAVEAHLGVAVDAVHDADPAGRPAEQPAAGRGRPGRRGEQLGGLFRHLAYSSMAAPRTRRPARLDLALVQLRRRLHPHLRRPGHRDLPARGLQDYQAHKNGLASAAGVLVVIGSIIIATFALRVVSSLFRGGPPA